MNDLFIMNVTIKSRKCQLGEVKREISNNLNEMCYPCKHGSFAFSID